MTDPGNIARMCLQDFFDHATLSHRIQELELEVRRLEEVDAEREEAWTHLAADRDFYRNVGMMWREDFERVRAQLEMERRSRDYLEFELADALMRLSRYETVRPVRRNLLPELIDLTSDDSETESDVDMLTAMFGTP